MSDPKTSTDEILVHLVRPGGEVCDYHLAEGATLADLLRLSGVPPNGDRAVLVDGAPTEESLPLREGVVVAIVPGSGDAPAAEPWRSAVPAFGADTLFYCTLPKLTIVRGVVSPGFSLVDGISSRPNRPEEGYYTIVARVLPSMCNASGVPFA